MAFVWTLCRIARKTPQKENRTNYDFNRSKQVQERTYSPAIGTGKAATGAQANKTIGLIRSVLSELYGENYAEKIRIQYGGSTNSNNIGEFIKQPEIDGALVGGASLKVSDFASMVEQTARIKDS